MKKTVKKTEAKKKKPAVKKTKIERLPPIYRLNARYMTRKRAYWENIKKFFKELF